MPKSKIGYMSGKVSVDGVIVARLVDSEAVVPYYLGIVTCRSFGRSCQLVGIEIHCKDPKLLPIIMHRKINIKVNKIQSYIVLRVSRKPFKVIH